MPCDLARFLVIRAFFATSNPLCLLGLWLGLKVFSLFTNFLSTMSIWCFRFFSVSRCWLPPTPTKPTTMTATTSAAASALLVSFQLSGSARRGFQVTASRDEGWVSDGMFSRYDHFIVFPTREKAQRLLDRILSDAHFCPRYNTQGRVCDLAHWVCTDGAFAKA